MIIKYDNIYSSIVPFLYQGILNWVIIKGGGHPCKFRKHDFEIAVDPKGPPSGPTFWLRFKGRAWWPQPSKVTHKINNEKLVPYLGFAVMIFKVPVNDIFSLKCLIHVQKTSKIGHIQFAFFAQTTLNINRCSS